MSKTSVMITDDARSIRESIKMLLEDDFTVEEAASGVETLEKLQQGETYMVFLDVLMPGMDGIETLEKIKAFNQNVEVCMLSAVNDRTVVDRVKALGAFDYITKPFDVDRIRITLENMRRHLQTRGILPSDGKNVLN